MDVNDVQNVQGALNAIGSLESAVTHQGSMLKVWPKEDSIDTGWTWRWPFIDIFLFTAGPHSANPSIQFMSWGNKSYPIDIIFPLKTISFMKMDLPVPNNSTGVLMYEYGDNVFEYCRTHWWNHKEESYISDSNSLNCSDLYFLYSFKQHGKDRKIFLLPRKRRSLKKRSKRL